MPPATYASHPDWWPNLHALLGQVAECLRGYWRGPVQTQMKADGSPVSEADMAAHHMLTDGLLALGLNIPVVSEEGATQAVAEHATHWLVDPIDGTKSFLRGEPYFVVSVALMEAGKPVFGALAVPAEYQIYMGSKAHGAWAMDEALFTPKNALVMPVLHRDTSWDVLISSHHPSTQMKSWLNDHRGQITRQRGVPSAYKFCLLLEGEANIYPRLTPINSWDIAAGHALIEAAGGVVKNGQGGSVIYSVGQPEIKGFVAHAEGIEFHAFS